LVGLWTRKPSLMSAWTLIFPIAAVVLCAVARFQIRRSEGTLAGGSLALWGLTVSILAGAGFWAYQSAVFFAISQQADNYARPWLPLIEQGENYKALYRTLKPAERDLREDAPSLPYDLEQRFGARSDPQQNRGLVGQFAQRELVRFLQQPEVHPQIQSRG